MIKVSDIRQVKGKELFLDTFEVVRAGEEVFRIMGFNYGEKETVFTGDAEGTAEWLNSYFGLVK